MYWLRWRNVAAVLALTLLVISVQAQEAELPPPENDDLDNHAWVVYTQRGETGTTLIFTDPLTGTENRTETLGERYTILGRSVLFFDTETQRVRVATPNGQIRQHPFMQPEPGDLRLDWVIAADESRMAWTQLRPDSEGSFRTVTTVADADGSNTRQVLIDSRTDGLRVMPVAFSPDTTQLYLDYQPDLGVSPLPQYAGLFALDLRQPNSQPEFLPDEPGSYTGAGFGSGTFLRLAVTETPGAFDLTVYNLVSGFGETLPAIELPQFQRLVPQAGDILVSPDGKRAVYALSQVENFQTPQQVVRSVFVVVDLLQMTQAPLTDVVTSLLRPVAWTEDNSAVLFTSPQIDGTWKVDLATGTFRQVAATTYLGVLESPGE